MKKMMLVLVSVISLFFGVSCAMPLQTFSEEQTYPKIELSRLQSITLDDAGQVMMLFMNDKAYIMRDGEVTSEFNISAEQDQYHITSDVKVNRPAQWFLLYTDTKYYEGNLCLVVKFDDFEDYVTLYIPLDKVTTKY